jgi:hypothetical protein
MTTRASSSNRHASMPPASILELGACEGAMTRRLRHLFPSAGSVRSNLTCICTAATGARGRGPPRQGGRGPVCDIPLEADLIVMAEMLTYARAGRGRPEPVARRYLLTSYRGTFDTPPAGPPSVRLA